MGRVSPLPSPGLCQAPIGEGRTAWAPRGGPWAQTNQQVLRPHPQTLATEQPSPSGSVRGEALGIIQGASILILCAPLCHPILRGGGWCRGSCWAECQLSTPGGRGPASPLAQLRPSLSHTGPGKQGAPGGAARWSLAALGVGARPGPDPSPGRWARGLRGERLSLLHPLQGRPGHSRAFTSLSWGSLLWTEGAPGSARRGRPPFHAPVSILEVVRGP